MGGGTEINTKNNLWYDIADSGRSATACLFAYVVQQPRWRFGGSGIYFFFFCLVRVAGTPARQAQSSESTQRPSHILYFIFQQMYHAIPAVGQNDFCTYAVRNRHALEHIRTRGAAHRGGRDHPPGGRPDGTPTEV